jgi:hypothetical protein
MKKYGKWILGAIGAFMLLKTPETAADLVHTVWNGLNDAGDAISRFIKAL